MNADANVGPVSFQRYASSTTEALLTCLYVLQCSPKILNGSWTLSRLG